MTDDLLIHELVECMVFRLPKVLEFISELSEVALFVFPEPLSVPLAVRKQVHCIKKQERMFPVLQTVFQKMGHKTEDSFVPFIVVFVSSVVVFDARDGYGGRHDDM